MDTLLVYLPVCIDPEWLALFIQSLERSEREANVLKQTAQQVLTAEGQPHPLFWARPARVYAPARFPIEQIRSTVRAANEA